MAAPIADGVRASGALLTLVWDGAAAVGIDNLNDYYDPELKRDRAYELHKLGIKLYKADVCDGQFLDGVWRAAMQRPPQAHLA